MDFSIMRISFSFERLAPAWLLVSASLFLFSCAGDPVVATGLVGGQFEPCPDNTNCVSSDATDERHRVEPYRLKAPAQNAWHGLQNVLAAKERRRVLSIDDTYMHLEVESSVLRRIDDVEFNLRADQNIIAVRSASRTGGRDAGQNRERVEDIRQALQKRGLVE